MTLQEVDIVLRAAGTAELAVLAAVLGLSAEGPVRWLGPVFAVSVAAHLWCPIIYGNMGLDPRRVPLPYVGCVSAAVWFWMFSRAVFDDRYRPGVMHWAALAVIVGVGYAGRVFGDLPYLTVGQQFVSIAVIVVALVEAARERSDDLVSARRHLREGLIVGVGAYALGVATIEIFHGGGRAGPWIELADAGGILLLTLAGILALTRVRPGVFAATPSGGEAAGISGRDRDLIAALQRLMTVEHAYTEQGLTVPALARRLGTSEHALRRLINRGLGHRNFAHYVNGYRLDAAKARLADPADRAPILTIALDAGFASIGPFNRAFKDATGLTPTEFRRRARAQGVPDEKS